MMRDGMSLTFSDADEILKIIEQFPAAEVRFEHGDLKLYVRRSGAGPVTESSSAGDEPPVPAAASAAPVEARPARPMPSDKTAPAMAREGLTPVKAPMMGVFYASPAPQAPPFVTQGQRVAEGDDLCIIEVMKVMNLIKAPCAGIVEAVDVENASMVEASQPLMWIRPAGAQRG